MGEQKENTAVKKNEVLHLALDTLTKELKKEPLSPERVVALTETIKVLGENTTSGLFQVDHE